eukprot:TRINITY_DN9810_c0_g1_i1.p1 TRINITY_DN9810_c0_g1~~TRINITY_DN9810_c0_g1_i1.p1  ORF type:complete len:155 (-),score=10.60 TRINITY_DN9810_c0_g1_i1:41-472(-)
MKRRRGEIDTASPTSMTSHRNPPKEAAPKTGERVRLIQSSTGAELTASLAVLRERCPSLLSLADDSLSTMLGGVVLVLPELLNPAALAIYLQYLHTGVPPPSLTAEAAPYVLQIETVFPSQGIWPLRSHCLHLTPNSLDEYRQ